MLNQFSTTTAAIDLDAYLRRSITEKNNAALAKAAASHRETVTTQSPKSPPTRSMGSMALPFPSAWMVYYAGVGRQLIS